MTPSWEEREAIASKLGVIKCDHCLRLCPYCPRLLAVRPDLACPSPKGESEAITEPSTFRKAVNLSKAVVTHAVAGFPEADGALVARRLEICRTCENYDPGPPARCRACGCFLDIKLTWADQRCPINRW